MNGTRTIQELMHELNLVSKTALARNLNISIRTIHNYHDLAIEEILDFERDYPEVRGMPYTRSAMTLYQTWVIVELIKIGSKFPRKILPSIIKNLKLSKKDYLATLTQETENNDITTVCRVA